MRQVSGAELAAFVAEQSVAAIHLDAEWDVGYRPIVRATMLEAEKALNAVANFGEVDVDGSPELAVSVGLLNVPAVAYYRDGKLAALMYGASQNIRARMEQLLRGELIT